MRSKPPSASCTRTTEIVLPNDTNPHGILMGGRLLHLMDICGVTAAMRHSNRHCVTAAVDHVSFASAVRLGEVLTIEARVTRAFTSSMEVEVTAWAEDTHRGEQRECNRAFFTFVAVDQSGRSIPVPHLEPETEEEQHRYEAAGYRRELRLSMGDYVPGDPEDFSAVADEATGA